MGINLYQGIAALILFILIDTIIFILAKTRKQAKSSTEAIGELLYCLASGSVKEFTEELEASELMGEQLSLKDCLEILEQMNDFKITIESNVITMQDSEFSAKISIIKKDKVDMLDMASIMLISNETQETSAYLIADEFQVTIPDGKTLSDEVIAKCEEKE